MRDIAVTFALVMVLGASILVVAEATTNGVWMHEQVHTQYFTLYGIESRIEMIPYEIPIWEGKSIKLEGLVLEGITIPNEEQYEQLTKQQQMELDDKHLALHAIDYPRSAYARGGLTLLFLLILAVVVVGTMTMRTVEEKVAELNTRNAILQDIREINRSLYVGIKQKDMSYMQKGNEELVEDKARVRL